MADSTSALKRSSRVCGHEMHEVLVDDSRPRPSRSHRAATKWCEMAVQSYDHDSQRRKHRRRELGCNW